MGIPKIDPTLVDCYSATVADQRFYRGISSLIELRLDPTRKGMVRPRDEGEQGTTMVMAKRQEGHNSFLISQLAVPVVYLH